MTPSQGRYVPGNREVGVLALWTGMTMGVGEAMLFMAQKAAGKPMYVNADVLWAATLLDTAICLLAAGALLAVARVLPWARARIPLALAFLLFLNWVAVALYERLHLAVYPIVAGGLAVVAIDFVESSTGRLHRFVRRSYVWVAAVVVLVGLAVPVARRVNLARAVAALPTAEAGLPNVLILLIDAFRADHASLYGYDRPTTPQIDRFAQGGVVFDRAYATSSYTLASHASILTGLLPHQHRAQWDDPMKYRDCDCKTLGEELQARGYVTAGFSANPFWFTREYGFARGFHSFEDFFDNASDAAVRPVFGRVIEKIVLPRLGFIDIPGRKSAEFSNRRLLRWLGRQSGRPFFAFVNYFDVHDPYLPPEPYRSRFAGRPVGGAINWRLNGLAPQLSDSVIRDEIDAYDGAVSYIDEQIGVLLDSLRAAGVLDNTIVVITSDHGEEFGEHGLVLHGHSLFTQSIHVPLIIRGPGVDRGVRIVEPVTNAALPSTLSYLVSGENDFPLMPLLGSMAGAPDPPAGELVEKPWGPESFPTFHGALQSVVEGRWHFIRHDTFAPQLFDLLDDPVELNDLAGDPAHAEVVRRLNARIDAMWASGSDKGGLEYEP